MRQLSHWYCSNLLFWLQQQKVQQKVRADTWALQYLDQPQLKLPVYYLAGLPRDPFDQHQATYDGFVKKCMEEKERFMLF